MLLKKKTEEVASARIMGLKRRKGNNLNFLELSDDKW